MSISYTCFKLDLHELHKGVAGNNSPDRKSFFQKHVADGAALPERGVIPDENTISCLQSLKVLRSRGCSEFLLP
ncbi:hypothetical protein SRHO_G00098250 [Serrasalmus rhombeus]